MLGALRSKKNNPVIVLLLGFVVVLMAGFGVTFSGGSKPFAAKVGDEVVTYPEFRRRYRRMFDFRQRQSSPQQPYDRARAKAENLKQQVLDQVVEQKLLALEAKRRGLRVNDETLLQEIMDFEFLQVEGQFDPDAYERFVRGQGMNPKTFEDELREELLATQLRVMLTQSPPSEIELKSRWEDENTKLELRFIKIENNDLVSKVESASDEDVETWKKGEDDVDKAVTDFYRRNKTKRYDVPKKVCARHILIKSPKGTPPDVRKKHRETIREAGRKIASKAMSFEAAAKEYSEDSSASKGGDLGCFGPNQMVPAFEEAAFGLDRGSISDLVESVYGYHLIQVYDIKEPIRKKLDEVRSDIEKELAKEAVAARLAREKAQQILTKSEELGGLEKALDSLYPATNSKVETQTSSTSTKTVVVNVPLPNPDRPPLEETGEFSKSQRFVAKLGLLEGISKKLWSLGPQSLRPSEPLKVETGWVVPEFVDLTSPDEEEYESGRRFLLYRTQAERGQAIYKRVLEALRAQTPVEVNQAAVSYDQEVLQRAFPMN